LQDGVALARRQVQQGLLQTPDFRAHQVNLIAQIKMRIGGRYAPKGLRASMLAETT
jgi:hypothetical protein